MVCQKPAQKLSHHSFCSSLACTAVVTELAYHEKPTIDADVSFLSEAEWRAELAVLLHDLVDEDGNVKRSTDLKSDAGVAWQKVHRSIPFLFEKILSEPMLGPRRVSCYISGATRENDCRSNYCSGF